MDLAFWRDIAIVFLVLQTSILLLILVIPFYFAVRGLNVAHVRLPGLLGRAKGISRQVRERTAEAGDKVTSPLLWVQRNVAKSETIVRDLTPGVQSGQKEKQL